jgi:nitrite reductase/ring-hydroxylating ferredoxin subunit
MSRGKRQVVCRVDELKTGERKIVQLGERSIGVFNVNGAFIAVLNVCPHELAPVCAGSVTGTTERSAPGEYRYVRGGEILRCPWHGWEFDLLNGSCLTDARTLKRFEVEVDQGMIYVRA